jgi:hypothetical protein
MFSVMKQVKVFFVNVSKTQSIHSIEIGASARTQRKDQESAKIFKSTSNVITIEEATASRDNRERKMEMEFTISRL